MLLTLAACYKETDYSALGGYYGTDLPAVSSYMTDIVNELVTLNLDELENALSKSDDPIGRMFYDTGNYDSLYEDGSSWRVARESRLQGLTISKVTGSDAWLLSYEGDFSLSGNEFPTEYSIRADRVPAQENGGQDWKVTLSGSRTEEDGYSCSFATPETILYKVLEDGYWNAFGYLRMDVSKAGTMIDKLLMEVSGGRNDVKVTRIK